jgi:hypothetical protein
MSKVTPCVKAPTNLLKGNPPSNPKPKDGFLLIRQFEHPPAPPCRMLHAGAVALMPCTKLDRGYFASFNGWYVDKKHFFIVLQSHN